MTNPRPKRAPQAKPWTIALAGGMAAFILLLLVWSAKFFGPSRAFSGWMPAEGAPGTMTAPQNAPNSMGGNSSVPISSLSPAPAPTLTAQARRQMQVLDEILASRNDNDPRMDTELRQLDESAKAAFKAKYNQLSPEKRNDRGTVVFLLGRNLTTPDDIGFLKEVLGEAPCLSMTDCTRDAQSGVRDEEHDGGSIGLVLAYPQLNALKALQNSLEPNHATEPAMREAARDALNWAKKSRSPIVVRYAERIEPR